MRGSKRPKGLTETSIFMSITNAMGWAIIDWSKPNARVMFVIFTMLIAIGYLVLWCFWEGRNWARILVLLTSLLALYNLRYFFRGGIIDRVMIGSEAAIAVFLLFWLNSSKVKSFFVATNKRENPISS
jgi:hypothetical protein